MGETVRTHVLLDAEAARALDELAGPRGRSRLIQELILAEVKRRKAREAVRAVMARAPSPDSPAEWATPEGALAWIRAMREDSPDPWAGQ